MKLAAGGGAQAGHVQALNEVRTSPNKYANLYSDPANSHHTEWIGRTDYNFTEIIEVILDYRDLKGFTQIRRN